MKAVELSQEIQRDIAGMQPQVVELIRALCAIPAPSHHEERRAAFVQSWLSQRGISSSLDEAKNVYFSFGLDAFEEIVVVMAHMVVVGRTGLTGCGDVVHGGLLEG